MWIWRILAAAVFVNSPTAVLRIVKKIGNAGHLADQIEELARLNQLIKFLVAGAEIEKLFDNDFASHFAEFVERLLDIEEWEIAPELFAEVQRQKIIDNDVAERRRITKSLLPFWGFFN